MQVYHIDDIPLHLSASLAQHTFDPWVHLGTVRSICTGCGSGARDPVVFLTQRLCGLPFVVWKGRCTAPLYGQVEYE